MKRKFFIIGIALIGLISCKSISYAYERWYKFGAKKIEVKKALLECGAPTPFYSPGGGLRDELNLLASIHLCMVESGFRYDDARVNWCRDRPEGRLAVCNGPMPVRSVSRRLDSYYCKYGTGVPVCILTEQDGFEACERKKNDPPPAECLP